MTEMAVLAVFSGFGQKPLKMVKNGDFVSKLPFNPLMNVSKLSKMTLFRDPYTPSTFYYENKVVRFPTRKSGQF